MLKKAMLGVVLGLTMVPMVAMAVTQVDHVPPRTKSAATIQQIVAPAGKQDVYVIKSTQNGKAVANITMSVLPGTTSPFGVGVQHSFVSSSSTNAAGTTSLTPGTYTTGLTGMIERGVKHPNIVHFNVTDAALVSMTTVHGVQLPDMNTVVFDKTIALAPGETLKQSGYSKSGGTTVITITRE